MTALTRQQFEPLICLRCDGTGKASGIGGGVTRCQCCGGRGVEYVARDLIAVRGYLYNATVADAGDGV